jgi:hypothetical protein
MRTGSGSRAVVSFAADFSPGRPAHGASMQFRSELTDDDPNE